MIRMWGIALSIGISAALGLWPGPSKAGIAATQVKRVEAAPAANAALPLDIHFINQAGQTVALHDVIANRPSVVVFVDYTCHTLCGPILDFVAAGLAKSGLKPGVDYNLVVIGIDPRDGTAAAAAMRAEHFDGTSPIERSAVFLTGHDAEIRSVTQAVGFRYYYDAEHDQYAHPAAVYIVDKGGHVQRVLSPLGLDGADLRLAIVDAGKGTVGTLADRIHLLCYGYDPVSGIYTERITTLLSIAAGTTLVALLGGISLMATRQRRRLSS